MSIRLLAVLIALPGPLAAAPVPLEVAETRASQAASQLQGRLQSELMAAMASGGPVAAIAVCRSRAPAIADEVSAATGVRIGRTALRWRNPANRPDRWEQRELQRFAARVAAGTPVPALGTASRSHRGQLQWLKPIPMGGMCLSCHGSSEVTPATAAAIAAAYPDDRARGFALGDVRGAFRARVPLR